MKKGELIKDKDKRVFIYAGKRGLHSIAYIEFLTMSHPVIHLYPIVLYGVLSPISGIEKKLYMDHIKKLKWYKRLLLKIFYNI